MFQTVKILSLCYIFSPFPHSSDFIPRSIHVYVCEFFQSECANYHACTLKKKKHKLHVVCLNLSENKEEKKSRTEKSLKKL